MERIYHRPEPKSFMSLRGYRVRRGCLRRLFYPMLLTYVVLGVVLLGIHRMSLWMFVGVLLVVIGVSGIVAWLVARGLVGPQPRRR
jgi:hypothetical protein